jgi:uncharacterized membrane protein YcaP (DUF421 family)
MNSFSDSLSALLGLGLEPKQLTFLQISLRGVIVFIATLIIVRLSDRRSLTKKSPFDQILIVILASILSRAINGSSTFWSTIGGAAVLVLLHRLLALASCRWLGIAVAIKGQPHILVEEGQLRTTAMRKNHVSRLDLEEDLRLGAKRENLRDVKIARLEASGDVSFIMQKESA